MGEVYLAEDVTLERRVALKVLSPGFASDPARLARFEREAKAVAALNHPHIVTIYSVEEFDGVRFITMELVEGESLAWWVRPGGLPIERVCDIGIALADALAAAHEKGIVHRDLKPGNVMVTPEGRVKVLDFGLAKLGGLLGGDSETNVTRAATLTTDGAIVGTVPYMSPEQLQGLQVDHRSDLFSLGVLLYELALGERPFVGGNAAAVTSSILRDTPPLLAELRADAPGELSRIVAHCLRKDARDRYQTARDVYNNLRELRRDLEGTGRELSGSGSHNQSRPPGTPGSGLSWGGGGVRSSAASGGAMGVPLPISQGTARVPASTAAGQPDVRTARPLRVIAAAVALGLLLGAGAWIVRKTLPSSSTDGGAGGAAATAKSVAVMPFTHLSPDKDQEYFTIGLAEELVNSLARVPDLRVAAYKARPGQDVRALDLQSIAEQMHVGTALQGSVTKAGNRVRIRVQLVELSTGHNLWSDTYDRTLDDIFAVQDDIARSVAAALQVTLFAEPNSPRPGNPEAYNLVLQAQYLRNVGGRDELQRALQLLQQAATIDPANARVFAELSRVHLARAGDGLAEDAEYGEAWKAATHAVELDPRLADAHQAVGWFSMVKNWDWQAADESFKKALALEPRNVRALRSAAALAGTLGHLDEAIALGLRAVDMEPANASIYYNLGILQRKAGQLDAALINGRRALELEPRMPHAHFQVGAALLLKGSIDDAMRAFQQEQDHTSRPRGLAMGYHTLGRPADSERYLQQLIAEHRDDSAREIAQVYAWRAEKDPAFEWLDRAFAQRDIGLAELKGEPLFRNLQDDPRWTAFLRDRLELPM